MKNGSHFHLAITTKQWTIKMKRLLKLKKWWLPEKRIEASKWVCVFVCAMNNNDWIFGKRSIFRCSVNQYDSSHERKRVMTKLFCFGPLQICDGKIYGFIVEIGCAYNLYWYNQRIQKVIRQTLVVVRMILHQKAFLSAMLSRLDCCTMERVGFQKTRKVNHWSNRVDKFCRDDSFIIHHCISLYAAKTALAIILIGVNRKVEHHGLFRNPIGHTRLCVADDVYSPKQMVSVCTMFKYLQKCSSNVTDISVAWLIFSSLRFYGWSKSLQQLSNKMFAAQIIQIQT